MTEAWTIPVRIAGTSLGAAVFALIFSGPIHAVMKRRQPQLRFAATFVAAACAIFVEYWLAAAGGGVVVAYVAGEHHLAVGALLAVTTAAATFLAGAWLFGWALGAPRESRMQHGAAVQRRARRDLLRHRSVLALNPAAPAFAACLARTTHNHPRAST
jgi:hypothetical protein